MHELAGPVAIAGETSLPDAAGMDDPDEMRVVAAGFAEPQAAAAAEEELRQRLDLERGDVEVAPAGGDSARRGLGALLAGRFRWGRKDVVDEVVKRHAGEVLEEHPENRVRRSPQTQAEPRRGGRELPPVEPP